MKVSTIMDGSYSHSPCQAETVALIQRVSNGLALPGPIQAFLIFLLTTRALLYEIGLVGHRISSYKGKGMTPSSYDRGRSLQVVRLSRGVPATFDNALSICEAHTVAYSKYTYHNLRDPGFEILTDHPEIAIEPGKATPLDFCCKRGSGSVSQRCHLCVR